MMSNGSGIQIHGLGDGIGGRGGGRRGRLVGLHPVVATGHEHDGVFVELFYEGFVEEARFGVGVGVVFVEDGFGFFALDAPETADDAAGAMLCVCQNPATIGNMLDRFW